MLSKILVANRGEIAVRVMTACREMDIDTVAVYSDADAHAAHVLAADQAIHLGPSNPTDSYLNIDKIIAAVKESGAEAVHPGYGFLAENPTFAQRCEAENIIFIGPPSHVIRNLGDKTIARSIMMKGGVPVIPGMTEPESDPARLAQEAENIGYPVMVKAAAGGGGKGMRVVNRPEDLAEECSVAAGEAQSAFGSGAIYLEKYLPRPRHVEVQILADANGNAVHLLERECSIQRRHQKIIEETPSPALTPELRAEMGAAAVSAATAAGYANAGTVEFLLDEDGSFYFLEVNTRLQVEHPITEMITGVDLVHQQIRIAAGEPLTLSQKAIHGRGHAIECRIYAEDPENGFFPSPGEITFFKEPTGPGIRNDCGVYSGFSVPVEYDPILSKLVVHAETRDLAISRMLKALSEFVVTGIRTPIPFLMDVLKSDAFQAGDTYTDFIETHFSQWSPPLPDADLCAIAFLIDELAPREIAANRRKSLSATVSPWQTLGNWCL